MRYCGCKSSPFIRFINAFFILFWKYFLKYWLFGLYKGFFLMICDFVIGVFENLNGFSGVWWFDPFYGRRVFMTFFLMICNIYRGMTWKNLSRTLSKAEGDEKKAVMAYSVDYWLKHKDFFWKAFLYIKRCIFIATNS